MLRRLIILVALAAVVFAVYSNRHRVADLAGLESNKVRIQGNWHVVVSGFPEDDIYTFDEDTVSKNLDPVGVYKFKSYNELEVKFEGMTGVYIVEFVDYDNMNWYQEMKGERKLRRQWRR